MTLADFSLPGDCQLYGWNTLETETVHKGWNLQVLFQGNGLFFNRGSVLFDGENLLDYPNLYLAGLLEETLPRRIRDWLAISARGLKRPLLFFVTHENRTMSPYLHSFDENETYAQGMSRLTDYFRCQHVQSALAASPPLILPDIHHAPVYLSLTDALGRFHANDVRHTLYCPYENAVLLSAEFGRAQCLDPERLADSLRGVPTSGMKLQLRETLILFRPEELCAVLDRKGYAGRYTLSEELTVEHKTNAPGMSIAPLEGIYSHLLPILTRDGRFGLIQTSGTHGNVTGNDGPTFRQLSSILRDLNTQPPFDRDPIIAASSGSQGNDVPNVVCRGSSGKPGLLADLCPQSALDDAPVPRGVVTTPRVGLAIPAALS
jgi:hypothetical protein